MHIRPVARIDGQLDEAVDGQKATYGGSNDTEVSDWHVNPSGPESSNPVTTVTPVQKCPRIARMVEGVGTPGADGAR